MPVPRKIHIRNSGLRSECRQAENSIPNFFTHNYVKFTVHPLIPSPNVSSELISLPLYILAIALFILFLRYPVYLLDPVKNTGKKWSISRVKVFQETFVSGSWNASGKSQLLVCFVLVRLLGYMLLRAGHACCMHLAEGKEQILIP